MNYNEMLRLVAGRTGLTRRQADAAVAGTMTVLAETISAKETKDLLAQLPKTLRDRVPVSAEVPPMRPIEFVAGRRTDRIELERGHRKARTRRIRHAHRCGHRGGDASTSPKSSGTSTRTSSGVRSLTISPRATQLTGSRSVPQSRWTPSPPSLAAR